MHGERKGAPGLWDRLRGSDGATRPALPIGELLHPVVLAAIAVLLVNDWVLKPSTAPVWLTGKLSDVAGLVFAPLVLTAVIDLALLVAQRAGAEVDPWLGPRRLAAAILATGAVFVAVKLSEASAAEVARMWSWFGVDARIYPDRTDLIALPALAVAAAIGRAEIARLRSQPVRSSTAPTAARAGRP